MATRQYAAPSLPSPVFVNETKTAQEMASPASVFVNETVPPPVVPPTGQATWAMVLA
jgi:hypothetical protein